MILRYDIVNAFEYLSAEHAYNGLFQRNSFKYIDKQALLNSLQITDEQFLDICLLAGDPNLITTFPPMSSPSEGSQLSFSWANIMDLIRTYGSGFNIAQAWAEHPTVSYFSYIYREVLLPWYITLIFRWRNQITSIHFAEPELQ